MNTVTTIRDCAFCYCLSLQSINIPNTVTTIEDYAFCYCLSLKSIDIPIGVKTIKMNVFPACDTLKQRLKYGTNYHPHIGTWLRRRFDSLPIHQACYDANDDAQSGVVDHLSTLVQQQYKQALTATDAMDMTPLHILCCNPHITAEMVRVVVEKDEEYVSAYLAHTGDVTGSTPLELFMRCRGYLLVNAGEQVFGAEVVESMPSLCDLLEKGIEVKDLSILFALNDNQQVDMSGKDEETSLFPFMSAAVLPGCGLDVVFTLATNDLDEVVSSTQNVKRDAVSNEYDREVKRIRID